MCLGIPGQILDYVDNQNDIATVEVSGVRRNSNVGLVRQEGIGEWITWLREKQLTFTALKAR